MIFSILAVFGLGVPELVIIGAIILLLFGSKKIPDLMKSIGRGIRDFKNESKEEDKPDPH